MNYLSKFRKNHNIDKCANLSNIQVAVEGISEANKLAWDKIAYIDTKTEKEGLIVHTHLNLIGRIFEHAEGMLACIANNCPASSEALGRVVTEGSVNLMYLSCFGDENTIAAYFNVWVSEHHRKLSEWKIKIKDKSYAKELTRMIDQRLSAVEKYEWFVDLVVRNLSLDKENLSKRWPKSLYKRFEALGLEEAYYSTSHRLSGSSHITAEDTISWLISLQQDSQYKESIAKEAWSYSIMMSRISCTYFIDAIAACCTAHGFSDDETISRLSSIKDNLVSSVSEISESAGCPA